MKLKYFAIYQDENDIPNDVVESDTLNEVRLDLDPHYNFKSRMEGINHGL